MFGESLHTMTCCCGGHVICNIKQKYFPGRLKGLFQKNVLLSPALIVHEGPSVFRIFNRWQAVNQQWKVLNYDKSMDSEDLKAAATDRTLSHPSQIGRAHV